MRKSRSYLDDLLVGHTGQEDVLLVLVGMEPDNVWDLAVTEPLQTLSGLRVPEFHLTVVTARQELPSIIRESHVLDGLHMPMECPQAISMCIHVPQLTAKRYQ